jgi:hopanoid-associated phosphorylase
MIASGDASQRTVSREPRLAIVIALGIEKSSLQSALEMVRPGTGPVLIQSGPGAVCAARAARAAVADGATALVSWGIAGALEPELAPGTVVIPTRIAAGEKYLPTDAAWSARLAERLQGELTVHRGDLLAAEHVLGTPRTKARAALESGCVAVDMESGAIAGVAAQAGVPVVVVRVIADGVTDTLPPNIADWVTADGRRRVGPVLNAILAPSQWRDLARLARRHRVADRALVKLARRLVPTSFERAAAPAPSVAP